MNQVDLYLSSRQKHISANYLRDASAILHAWYRFDNGNLLSIQIWLDSLAVKPATLCAYAFQLRKYFDWCIAKGYEKSNPALELDLPRARKPFRKNFIQADTVRRLISECKDMELRYCLFAGFHAGLRFGEVVASQPHWFDLSSRMISVLRDAEFDTKDHTDRDVPITDAFYEFLKDYGPRYPYMIGPHKLHAGRNRYRFDFSTRFENYVRFKRVKMTFHDCRRTFCSLHAQSGTSIYKIAKWVGDDVDVVQKHYGFLSETNDPEINRAFAAC